VNEQLQKELLQHFSRIIELFDEQNKEAFLSLPWIPKSHLFPSVGKWWENYQKGDPAASCNGTNRNRFYDQYKNYLHIFYPEQQVKPFNNLDDCEMSKISDLKRVTYEHLSLPFEEIDIEEFNKKIKEQQESVSPHHISDTEKKLKYEKKYLKYKLKYAKLTRK
jgi:hypothetical protein